MPRGLAPRIFTPARPELLSNGLEITRGRLSKPDDLAVARKSISSRDYFDKFDLKDEGRSRRNPTTGARIIAITQV